MTEVFSLKEIIDHARKNSPFYRELYQHLPEHTYGLAKLPIINRSRFCTANNYYNNKLLTGPMISGTVFKSGGTTGYPKFSFFSKIEWESFTTIFGEKLEEAGLESGDKVANLFYAGDLYAAFLFYKEAIERCPQSVLQFPIGGFTSTDETIDMVKEFNINVLVGGPTTMISIADHLKRRNETLNVAKILFGGEIMFQDQKDYIRETMPGVKLTSIGYGSVDAGHLGYPDDTCGTNEHRMFSRSTIMEIVDDETGEPIEEEKKPGRLIFTNLTRLFMPIIRYPVGDRGMWVEGPDVHDRKFVLLGRAEDGVRLSSVTIGRQDVADVVVKYRRKLGISNFQLRITHEDTKDCLTINLASTKPSNDLQEHSHMLIDDFYARLPRFKELVDDHKVHPLRLQWIDVDALERNPRTGKLIVCNDCRGDG